MDLLAERGVMRVANAVLRLAASAVAIFSGQNKSAFIVLAPLALFGDDASGVKQVVFRGAFPAS